MAKDRFNNRASYDNSFKYGQSEFTQKSLRTTSFEQTEFIKQIFQKPNLNEWEMKFLKSVAKSNRLSEKQINKINIISKK